MNFKETYRHLNDAIVPDPKMAEHLLKKAGTQPSKQMVKKRGPSWFKTAAAILLLCAGLNISITVLAAHVEPVYQFLYLLSPRAAQYFMPIRMISEDQGIRMEVVSASVHENTAEIYISLEDLTGDRIDETTDLYDSYSIHRPFASVGTCERAGYDPVSGKAFFLITLQEQTDDWNGHPIQGDKITFSVAEFLSRKSTYEDLIVPMVLTDIPEEPPVKEVTLNGCSGDFEAFDIDHVTNALVPNTIVDILPSDGITLTAVGWKDGMLHIQTALKDRMENDNHGYLWLENENGKQHSVYSISFREELDNGHTVTYDEQIFDVSMEELSDCTLHGYFVISGQKTTGNWQVTFPLE